MLNLITEEEEEKIREKKQLKHVYL